MRGWESSLVVQLKWRKTFSFLPDNTLERETFLLPLLSSSTFLSQFNNFSQLFMLLFSTSCHLPHHLPPTIIQPESDYAFISIPDFVFVPKTEIKRKVSRN
jgi:hypothetical protein